MTSEPRPPRVFLVDDHALIRAGLRAELAGHVEVVGEADEVPAAIEMIIERTPDVVLLDVHMPEGGGLAVLRAVTKVEPAVKFLALSVSDAAEDVIAVVRAGARGYVTKNIEGPELVEAIVRTAAGDAVFPGDSPVLSWTRSPTTRVTVCRRRSWIQSSINSRRAKWRYFDSSRVAIRTATSPINSASPPRPSRATSRRSCANSSCPIATNSRTGPPSATFSRAAKPRYRSDFPILRASVVDCNESSPAGY